MVNVISVYAAAAFVILELTSIVAPSLGLPSWTLNLVIILLCTGFIIVTILSWVFDRHPEGGLVRTKNLLVSAMAIYLVSLLQFLVYEMDRYFRLAADAILFMGFLTLLI